MGESKGGTDDTAALRAENATLRQKVKELTAQLDESRSDLGMLHSTLEAQNSKLLDVSEAMEKLQEQHDVLENFVFAIERDHDRARAAVAATTREIERSYEALRALKGQQDEILGNIEQGIMTIGTSGVINQERSAATDRILGFDPSGRSLYDLFPDELKERVRRHVAACLGANAQPAMLARLNPLRAWQYTGASGGPKNLSATFVPMTRSGGTATQLMIVIDDLTVEHMLKAEIERQVREQAAIIERAYEILTLPAETVEEMLQDGQDTITQVETYIELRSETPTTHVLIGTMLEECLRRTHTVKGNARAFQLDSVYAAAHTLEDALAATGSEGEVTVDLRAAVDALRRELWEGQSLFDRLATLREGVRASNPDRNAELEGMLRRLVQREAAEAGLAAELAMESHLRTPVEPFVFFRLKSAIIQILRNAIAHGIEPGEVRVARGKPPTAELRVSFEQTEQGIEVVCRDDGRGVDREAVRRVAVTTGAITSEEAARLDPDTELNLLFKAGVTTRTSVDGLAGRGVGLDAVKESIESVGGWVKVTSVPGEFTEFRIIVPPTPADLVTVKGAT
jgi:signal transduction histidine kinase